ncbi:hypothetical protein [Mycoplasma enhydrae]|uniref:hypothetical protein n=1 Tax=Mycoplasma enhydrae TaxID=2499220 RepID=UPI00197C1064|nr:hypothetical protein [Mycoplasma enhydrae]MBN4089701.1 hypothetical protein [Mycoplasma enhydrae]
MKLIKYHAERNENAFRQEAYMIAEEFDKLGDYQLAEYIKALLWGLDTFGPQEK